MPLLSGQQYLDSIKKMKTKVYIRGKLIKEFWNHPEIKPTLNAIALSYDLALDAENESTYTAISHLTGRKINMFTQIHMNPDDLIRRVQQMKNLTPRHGGCVGARCVGSDAINAIYAISYDIDIKMGTSYHTRVQNWLKYIQENDLAVSGMVTDAKANRKLGPHKQPDPDVYLRVVKETEDGIIVRGAKAHQSGALHAHENLILPTEALTPDDKPYALAFATPTDAEGIIHIFESPACTVRRSLDESDIDVGNYKYGVHGASLVVFNDVFVPWERVFMYGETEFAGPLVLLFANYHRLAFCGCKSGHCDLMVGALTVANEYAGLDKVNHIKEKMTDIMINSELGYGCAIGAARLGARTPSGVFQPDSSLTNAAKLQMGQAVCLAGQKAFDITGGLLCTVASEKDLRSPEIGKYVEKYFAGVEGVKTENRIRIVRLIEYLSGQSSVIPAESVLGGGAPETQRVMVRAAFRRKEKQLVEYAKNIAGIKD
ncbi:MAG: 4-hydroxybutyryl-CoA dehydratase [Eubacteriales bacterium]|jgi:4-hydroxybutyryl-CoA dehydratase/vinylacetyl-CoA-Delta-isomerase|nr:4-hydroxybutyryl-CoA dehydratase [Eubacteriales bacterium]